MEKLIPAIENYCTFPLLEKRKLFRRVLFCFLAGNEDMHLKNFSLITRNHKIELSPAYDLLNSTISMDKVAEEMALPIAGKKRSINKADLFGYYAEDRLKLTVKTIRSEAKNLVDKKGEIERIIKISFLSKAMKDKYTELIRERYRRLAE